MLKDRRNCFRGLMSGFEFFLKWPPIGDALRDEEFEKARFARLRGMESPASGRRGDRFSCVGESAKISERDREEDVAGLDE